jgi:hypothetical protein
MTKADQEPSKRSLKPSRSAGYGVRKCLEERFPGLLISTTREDYGTGQPIVRIHVYPLRDATSRTDFVVVAHKIDLAPDIDTMGVTSVTGHFAQRRAIERELSTIYKSAGAGQRACHTRYVSLNVQC